MLAIGVIRYYFALTYAFNSELAQNGIVNKALIYGKNGIGKSNLGITIFDIISHLTDKERMPDNYVENYLNLNSVNQPACFVYVFQFGDDEIIYNYSKKGRDDLIRETLQVNGDVVLDYDYFDENTRFISADLIGTLNVDLVDNKLSVIKYIYRNTRQILLLPSLRWFNSAKICFGTAVCPKEPTTVVSRTKAIF